jgi:phage FluMu protein Com
MEEFRCQNCHRLLFKGEYLGVIQIMCGRCKKINEIECQLKEEHQSE